MNATVSWQQLELIGIEYIDGTVEPETPPEFIERYNTLVGELYKLHGEMVEWLQGLPDKSQAVTFTNRVLEREYDM